MNNTADVCCYHCLNPNRIKIGVQFFDAMAWFKCHSCGNINGVTIQVRKLRIPEIARKHPDVQIGQEIKE